MTPWQRLITVLLTAASLAGCSQSLTVEQQVIATIRQMEEKIEAGQRLAFMEHVDEAFSGQQGTMNRDQVRAFHAAALAAGGMENGGPGIREQYHPDYYGAFVIDPDGHNIEAVCHDSES